MTLCPLFIAQSLGVERPSQSTDHLISAMLDL